jgi:hypothetical protein
LFVVVRRRDKEGRKAAFALEAAWVRANISAMPNDRDDRFELKVGKPRAEREAAALRRDMPDLSSARS